MEYFNVPHIPNICSKGVVADCRISPESVKKLNSLGIEVILSYKSENLLPPISAHPDMTILHLGGNRFVCSPDSYDYYKERLNGADVARGVCVLKKDYPNDVPYNITIFGEYVFLNASSNQTEIAKTYVSSSKKILNVKQGYTKCNICVVSRNALITSDTGIYKTAVDNKIDALLIESGYIELKGMDCGFIGGASGLIAPNMLAVNGDIKTHPDGCKMIEFCKKHGVDVISLKKGILEDIGTILPIF
ncbi:MAG: hypothetical protein LUD03_02370 [Firmicutes bacterium]|nr:hypothetical protein [Bacillota bacterium]